MEPSAIIYMAIIWRRSFNVTEITVGRWWREGGRASEGGRESLRTKEQLGPGEQMETPQSEEAPLTDSSSPSYLFSSHTHTQNKKRD